MKNKIQKIVFIDGSYCGFINDYLEKDWCVVSVNPVGTKQIYGAYVVLEKEIAAAGEPVVE